MHPVAIRNAFHSPWSRILLGVLALALLLVLGVLFFPWDMLRGPLNRYVTEHTGRHFEITRRLDVKLGRTTRLVIDADRALSIHIDGELFAPYEANVRHVEINLVPGAIQVLV